MLRKRISTLAGLGMLAIVASLVSIPAAQATPLNYNFTVTVTSGSLTGEVDHGSFSFDSSVVVPDSEIFANGLLDNLAFTFNGISYDTSNADTGRLYFDASGNLYAFVIGNACHEAAYAPGCITTAGLAQWATVGEIDSNGGFYPQGFGYTLPGTDAFGSGDVTFAQVGGAAAVPEPGTLGLFGLGLLVLGAIAWRRRRFA